MTTAIIAGTEPVALARRARHRKPNRRRGVVRTVLTVAAGAAVLGGMIGAAAVPSRGAFYGLTPAQALSAGRALSQAGSCPAGQFGPVQNGRIADFPVSGTETTFACMSGEWVDMAALSRGQVAGL